MQFDRAKLKALILRAAEKCESSQLGAVKLHKVAYFADMLNFAESGAPITGATYRKQIHGPICEQLLQLLREMQRSKEIEIREVDYFGYKKKEFIPKAKSEIDRFSKKELSLIDDIIDFVCKGHTAKAISEYSHNRAWEMAEFGEVLPYPSVFFILPSQVSPEAFEWAAGEAENLEKERSNKDALGDVTYADFRSRLQAT